MIFAVPSYFLFGDGSGTTIVVANKLKRKYICIEKENDYWDLTFRRIKDYENKEW